MVPDVELLRRYTETGSEAAFTELVGRHVDLVYSVALRVVGGDTHLAQDVSQAVFTDLARKARQLSRHAMLAGWLHTSARFAASKLIRAERRRQTREQRAAAMPDLSPEPEMNWGLLRPVLDEAVGHLGARDREAVLLRYFEGKEFKQIGATLGLNEDAARMRVDRALERLRRALIRRGVSLSAAALAATLSSGAVTMAPATLATRLACAALTGAASSSSTPAILFSLMKASTPKIIIANALLLCGLGSWEIVQHQALSRLEGENAILRERADKAALLEQQNAQLQAAQMDPSELARLAKEHADLLRLRSEVTRLRQQAPATAHASVATTKETTPEQESPVTSFVASVQATVGDGGTLVTGEWTTKPGKRALVFVAPQIQPAGPSRGQVLVKTYIAEASDDIWASLGLAGIKSEGRETTGQQTFGAEDAATILKALQETAGVEVLGAPRVQSADGVPASVFIGQNLVPPGATEEVPIGHQIEITPRLSADNRTVDLTLQAKYSVLNQPKP